MAVKFKGTTVTDRHSIAGVYQTFLSRATCTTLITQRLHGIRLCSRIFAEAMQVEYLARGYNGSVRPGNRTCDLLVTRPGPYPLYCTAAHTLNKQLAQRYLHYPW